MRNRWVPRSSQFMEARLSQAIWDWLVWALGWEYDVAGLGLFWRGSMIWLLLGLFALVNLSILVGILVRAFRGPTVDRDCRW